MVDAIEALRDILVANWSKPPEPSIEDIADLDKGDAKRVRMLDNDIVRIFETAHNEAQPELLYDYVNEHVNITIDIRTADSRERLSELRTEVRRIIHAFRKGDGIYFDRAIFKSRTDLSDRTKKLFRYTMQYEVVTFSLLASGEDVIINPGSGEATSQAFQSYDGDLTTLAAMTPSDGVFIVGNGTNWVAESGAVVRASLGTIDISANTNLVAGTGIVLTNDTLNVGALTVSELAANSLQVSSESFADNDTSLMTSAAIQDKIQTELSTFTSGVDLTAGTGMLIQSESNTASGDYSATITLDLLDEDNMASDSATKAASQQSVKAYVTAQVAALIDSAPAALDTLNELAAALGDDANYASATATLIGTKLAKASNLSDLASASTARSNLGLGSMAVLSSIDISSNTNLAAGAGLTLSGDTISSDLSVSSMVNDRIMTSSGSNSLQAESTFTFDGTNLLLKPAQAAAKLTVHADTNSSPLPRIEMMRGAHDTWGSGDNYQDWRITNENDLVFDSGTSSVSSGAAQERLKIGATGGLTVNNAYTLPASDGSANYVLKTNGSGVLSWAVDNNTEYNVGAGGLSQQNFTTTLKNKLDAIEASATADQTASEIRILVESATDSNVFTDTDHSKLNAIEASATADQTAAEIRTLVESASDSNVFTDADHSKLNAIEASATADQTASEITALLNDIASYSLGTADSGIITVNHDLTVAGDLIISGDTTTVNSNTVNIGDSIITLNSDETGTPSQDAGIEIERGTSTNKTLFWDESEDEWTIGAERFKAGSFEGDGSLLTALNGSQVTSGTIAAARVATLNQDTTGNAATATNVAYTGLTGTVPTWNQSTTGNSATATKITSITNSNIVQLTASQTLSNKTIAVSQVTELSNLTAVEGAQLENINSVTISNDQWGYLGAATGAITNINTQLTQAQVEDFAGGLFTGNTETGITATYQAGDNTVDLVVGTLNQSTTGNAATATTATYANAMNAINDRDLAPEDLSYSNDFQVFFTSKEGLEDGSTSGSNYMDAIVLNTWNDASGHDANVLAFDKSTKAIYHYQADQAATNWGTGKQLAYTDQITSDVTITANNDTDETVYLTFVDGATGAQGLESDTGLSYNPNSGRLTATTFVGSATSAATVTGATQSAITTVGDAFTIGSGTSQSATLNLTAGNTDGSPAGRVFINMAGNEGRSMGTTFTDSTYSGEEWFAGMRYSGAFNEYIIGYDEAGSQSEYAANTQLTINSNGSVTADTFVGALTGNVTGNVSGSSGSTTGNAATATILANARNIAGQSFNGSAAITIATGDLSDIAGLKDEDNMASNSNTHIATQQSIKAYVDGQISSPSGTVTVSHSDADANFPVVFHDESNALLDDTGELRYNPSTGTLLVPNLSVAGTTTQVNTVTMNAANAVVFEGATPNNHETTLTITDPTADRTITLPNASGTVAVSAGTGIDLSAAGAVSVDVSDFMANGANNRILTATGADGMNGESTLTYDGTNLKLASATPRLYISDTDNTSGSNDGNSLLLMKGGTTSYLYDRQASSKLYLGAANDPDIIVIDGANARVGIGTTSPSTALHVKGSGVQKITVESTDNEAALELSSDSTGPWIINSGNGSNDLRWYGNGAVRMQLTSAGNLGIGTTSPDETLHVLGPDSGCIAKFERTSGENVCISGTNGWGNIYTSDAVFAFGTGGDSGGDSQMVINGSNVGIGTTSPASLLHIEDDTTSLVTGLIVNNVGSAGNNATVSGIEIRNGAGTDSSTHIEQDAFGQTIFYTGQGAKNEAMRFRADGTPEIFKAGGGILSLSSSETTVVDGDKLGQINWYAPAEADGTGDSTIVSGSLWAEAEATFTDTVNKTSLVFATGASEVATEKMRILSDGKVGIGTTSPATSLHIMDNGDEDTVLTVESNEASGAIAPKINLYRNETGAMNSLTGEISFTGKNDANQVMDVARIISVIRNAGDGNEAGSLDLYASKTGNNSWNFLRLSGSNQNIHFNVDGNDIDFRYDTTQTDNFFRIDNGTQQASFLGKLGVGTNAPTATLHVDAPTTTAPSLTFGAAAGQILQNENSEFAFGLDNNSPYSLWIQGRTSGNAARDISLQPLGGKIGIGTEAPVPLLHLYGNSTETTFSDAGAVGLTIEQDGDGDAALSFLLTGIRRWLVGVDHSDADKFKISTAGTDLQTGTKLTIASDGNVGIGTDAPDTTLHVEGSVLIDAFTEGAGAGLFFREGHLNTNQPSITVQDHSGSHPDGLAISAYDGISFRLNAVEKARFDSAGKLGLGTTAPSNKLHLALSMADGDDGILLTRTDSSTSQNDILGGIGFDSSDGNIPSTITEASVALVAKAREDHGTGDKGGYLDFYYSANDQDDDTTSRIGMRMLQGKLSVGGQNSDVGDPINSLVVEHAGTDWHNGILVLRDDTSIASGDLLGAIGFDGKDGNNPSNILEASVALAAYASEDHGTGDKGGYLSVLLTETNDDDDTTSTEVMRVSTVSAGTSSTLTLKNGNASMPADTEYGAIDFHNVDSSGAGVGASINAMTAASGRGGYLEFQTGTTVGAVSTKLTIKDDGAIQSSLGNINTCVVFGYNRTDMDSGAVSLKALVVESASTQNVWGHVMPKSGRIKMFAIRTNNHEVTGTAEQIWKINRNNQNGGTAGTDNFVTSVQKGGTQVDTGVSGDAHMVIAATSHSSTIYWGSVVVNLAFAAGDEIRIQRTTHGSVDMGDVSGQLFVEFD